MFSYESISLSTRLWFVIISECLYLALLVERCSASVMSTTCILQHAVVCWVTASCPPWTLRRCLHEEHDIRAPPPGTPQLPCSVKSAEQHRTPKLRKTRFEKLVKVDVRTVEHFHWIFKLAFLSKL
jgi:hypothetical protein